MIQIISIHEMNYLQLQGFIHSKTRDINLFPIFKWERKRKMRERKEGKAREADG